MSDSECPSPTGEEFILTVQCGSNTAKLYLSKLRQGSRAACVMFEDKWLSPNQFQCISGRRTTKDWKRSIRHAGKTLRQLMSQGQLIVEPASCVCSSCTGQSSSENDTPTVSRLLATPIRPLPTKVTKEQSISPQPTRSPTLSPETVSPLISSSTHPANRDELHSLNTPMINNIAMPGCTIIPEANDYATSLSGQWTNYYTELFKASLAGQQASLANVPIASSSSNTLNTGSMTTPQLNALMASQQSQQQLFYQQYASVVDFYSSAARGHGIDMADYFNKLQQYCQQTPTADSLKRSETTPTHAPEAKRRHFENALDLSVRN